VILSVDEPCAERDEDRSCARTRIELHEHRSDIGLDCVFRQEEAPADLEVGQTVGDETNNLDLTLSKRLAGRNDTAADTRLNTSHR
jgi:hypothetical protein